MQFGHLLSLLALSSSAAAISSNVISAHTTRELHGRQLPPLADEVIQELSKKSPSEYQVFHNDPAVIRSVQSDLDSPDPQRRAAALSGLQTRCTASHCMALTFDDGPYQYHQNIQQQFTAAGMKPTFFVNGNNYGCIYDTPNVQSIRRSLVAGGQIASHTWSHPHLVGLTQRQLEQQVDLVETALMKTAGIVPAFFRPPYGETNDTITQFLNSRGYVVVTWNFDTQDADGATVDYSVNVIKGIKAPKHAIVLQHETVPTTSQQVVPQALKIVKQNGYSAANVMTVADSFALNPYKVKGSFSQRDSSWTCNNTPQPGVSY